MLDFYVYMLCCNDGSYYVGHTDNIEFRLNQHIETDPQVGSYVAKRLPVELVYVECVGARSEALEAERKLKGWSRKKKEALINNGWQAIPKVTNKGAFTKYPVDPSTKLREDG